jgi:hypothetical protein
VSATPAYDGSGLDGDDGAACLEMSWERFELEDEDGLLI